MTTWFVWEEIEGFGKMVTGEFATEGEAERHAAWCRSAADPTEGHRVRITRGIPEGFDEGGHPPAPSAVPHEDSRPPRNG